MLEDHNTAPIAVDTATRVRVVRAARNTPWPHPLIDTDTVERNLASLPPRGRCDKIAADALASNNPSARILAAISNLSAPPAKRLACTDNNPNVHNNLTGIPGWPARRSDNPTAPRPQLAATADNPTTSTSAAANPSTAPLLLERLARSHRVHPIRRSIAANPNTTTTTQRWLHHNHPDTHTYLASNPNIDTALAQQLAIDELSRVRSAVAAHTNIAQLLKTLVTDPDPDVREAAAANPHTASGLLAVMIHDNCNTVRQTAAANPNLDPAALTGLHNNDNYSVGQGAAANPNLAPGLLATLVDSSNDPRIRRAVAANPNTSPQLLQKLAEDTDTTTNRTATARLNPTPAQLAELSQDPAPEIRTAAAANKATPTADLIQMLADSCPQAQTAAVTTLRQRHNHMRRQRPTAQQNSLF